MFGENQINESYATFQPIQAPNHFFFVPDTVLGTVNNPWNMPLFYAFRSFQIVAPQIPSTLPTAHEMSSPMQPLTHFNKQKHLTNKAHLRRKRQPTTIEKELQSASKNSEPNIINQFYSFFTCHEWSGRIVSKSIQLLNKDEAHGEKIKIIFYNIVHLINIKRARKYVNTDNILRFFNKDFLKSEISNIEQELEKLDFLDLEEFCFLFRVITAYYIKNISIPAIMSSKRIKNIAKNVHLKRRRKILECILRSNQ